jgi:acyl-homoserine-lactone acylase
MKPARFGWIVLLALAAAAAANAAPRGVEILWDKYGVAHVYAQDQEGLFFGFGYAEMQSHGNLVLKMYGESRGRAAEYWGEPYLASDRWVQLNGVPERSAEWYRLQTPGFRRCLDAFADGMNTYADRHRAKLDPEMCRALPITGLDPIEHMHRIVNFTYMSSASALAAAVAKDERPNPPAGASNAWAISPARTAGGHTLMLMNPHLPWGDWSTYYEINLVMPGVNLYGASQVGFPVLRFVFSDVLGFTQTVNSLDGSDLYRITPKDGGYLFDGKVRPFERKEKTILVRKPDGGMRNVPLTILETVQGPVVWNRDGLMLAQRTVALDRPYMADQYWHMAIAGNFAEYQAQLARLQVPTFNITYADRDGHIMYLFNGTMPKRPMGDAAYWAGIVPGDTSRTLWRDILPYSALPKVIDPPTGWLQNTNDPPYSCTYPQVIVPSEYASYFPGPIFSYLRTIRSIRMQYENSRFTFQQLLADKASTRMEFADRILPDLDAAVAAHGTAKALRAMKVLEAWDRCAEKDSRGALLFMAFGRRFLGPSLTSFGQFAIPLDPTRPFDTPRGIKNPVLAAQMLDSAAAETESRYGSLDAPWGKFMRFKIGATDLPANGADGDLGAFRVMRFQPVSAGSPYEKAIFGDTFVACVEFSNPVHAEVLTSYGNSSQPGSSHHEDQLPLLARKELRPALRERAQVEANLESSDRF